MMVALLTIALAAHTSPTVEEGGATPATIANIDACRKIEANSARLECFDKAAAALDTAITERKIYFADKAQVVAARRSLFGLQLRDIDLFHLGNENEIDQIDLVVVSAKQDADGNWRCKMTNGTEWLQTDSIGLGRFPKAGSKATIRRASLGSFKMSVDGQPGVRARRLL